MPKCFVQRFGTEIKPCLGTKQFDGYVGFVFRNGITALTVLRRDMAVPGPHCPGGGGGIEWGTLPRPRAVRTGVPAAVYP
jgi:hypothetical protein